MSRYQPALLGGLFIGVLSSLPILNIANCCCLWVVSGGVLATYLLQQRTPDAVETSAAMLQGVMAGAIGALIDVLVSALFIDMAGRMVQMTQMLDRPDFPPEARDMMTKLMTGRNIVLLTGVIKVPLYAIF